MGEAKRKLREEKRRAKLIAEGKDPDKFPPKEQRLQRKVVEKVDHEEKKEDQKVDSEEKKGDKYVVFPSKEPPVKIPDLSEHHNYMGEVLCEKPEIYEQLRTVRSKGSVTLARCIKTGVENPAEFFEKPAGLVIGDLDCFRCFHALFDPVLQKLHEDYKDDSDQKHNLNIDEVDGDPLDEYGEYVASVRLSTGRSIGQYNLPPSISFSDRRAVERIIVDALKLLKDDLKGESYPLQFQKKLKKTSEEKFKKNKKDIADTRLELKKKREDLEAEKKKDQKDAETIKDLEKKVEEKEDKLKELEEVIKDDDYSLLDGSRSCFNKLFG